MAVTIRDVAREVGVSVAAVSHALTGYTDISVKTRQKIQEMARRLGTGRSRGGCTDHRGGTAGIPEDERIPFPLRNRTSYGCPLL